MMTTKLEPGTMVKLTERREGSSIKARSVPRSFNALLGEELDIVICDIPNETHALFINSQTDAFNAAIRKKGRGPYGGEHSVSTEGIRNSLELKCSDIKHDGVSIVEPPETAAV